MAHDDVWMMSDVDISALYYDNVTPYRSNKNIPPGDRYWEYVFIHVDNVLVSYR